MTQRKAPNLVNQVFNQLTVVSRNGTVDGRSTWNCLCSCGRIVVVMAKVLLSGNTKSCGCIKSVLLTAKNTTHNKANSGAYISWASMIQRCTNKNNPGYKNYGGRGIIIDPEWFDFENFYLDMGDRPEGYSIERLDNDEGYNRTNCAWIPKEDQAKNRRYHLLWRNKCKRDRLGRYTSN